jgi:hypothetical protein
MFDDLKPRGGQDRERIDVSQEHELRDWAERFGVSPTELKSVVTEVGDRAEPPRKPVRRIGKA